MPSSIATFLKSFSSSVNILFLLWRLFISDLLVIIIKTDAKNPAATPKSKLNNKMTFK